MPNIFIQISLEQYQTVGTFVLPDSSSTDNSGPQCTTRDQDYEMDLDEVCVYCTPKFVYSFNTDISRSDALNYRPSKANSGL